MALKEKTDDTTGNLKIRLGLGMETQAQACVLEDNCAEARCSLMGYLCSCMLHAFFKKVRGKELGKLKVSF